MRRLFHLEETTSEKYQSREELIGPRDRKQASVAGSREQKNIV